MPGQPDRTAGGRFSKRSAMRSRGRRPGLVNEDLRALPRLFWQQLSNRLIWAPEDSGPRSRIRGPRCCDDHLWLRLENPIADSASLVSTVSPLGGDLRLFSCDIAPDGRSMAVIADLRFAPRWTHQRPAFWLCDYLTAFRLPSSPAIIPGAELRILTGWRSDCDVGR